MTEWTLDQGLEYVRRFEDHVFWHFGYTIGLCGGVLKNGFSKKDLDIVCIPVSVTQRNKLQSQEEYELFVKWIHSINPIVKEQCVKWNDITFKYTTKTTEGKLVDWFIVCDNNLVDTMNICDKLTT